MSLLFQQFSVRDMLTAQVLYEEALFVSGTGSGQARRINQAIVGTERV